MLYENGVGGTGEEGAAIGGRWGHERTGCAAADGGGTEVGATEVVATTGTVDAGGKRVDRSGGGRCESLHEHALGGTAKEGVVIGGRWGRQRMDCAAVDGGVTEVGAHTGKIDAGGRRAGRNGGGVDR